jgi:hypothetical protein
MTVAELIEVLKGYPPDMDVEVANDFGSSEPHLEVSDPGTYRGEQLPKWVLIS